MSDELQGWLRGKLTFLSGQYRQGAGYGDIFESQYLCYLECLLAVRGQDPSTMWEAWKDRIREFAHVPEGEPVLAMNRQVGDDRPALIEELEAFKRRLVDGPSPRTVLRAEDLAPQPAAEPVGPPKLGTGRPEKVKKGTRGKVVAADQDGVFELFGE